MPLSSLMTEIRIILPSSDYAQFWCRKGGAPKPKVDEKVLRLMGAKHADIWARGALYPKDPLTGKHPDFNSVSALVKFACEGENGLLGYCENMARYIGHLCNCLHHKEIASSEREHKLKNSETKISELLEKINKLENRITCLEQENEATSSLLNAAQFQLIGCSEKCEAAEAKVQELDKKIKGLKSTPLGFRERQRKTKPIDELKPTSGSYRRRLLLMKKVLNTSKKKEVVREGVKNILKTIATKDEIISLLNDPKNNTLRISIMEMVIEEIHSKIDADQVQAMCDSSGISRQGYRNLFKPFQAAIKLLGSKKVVIPRPYHIESIRKRRNFSVEEVLGEAYSLEVGAPVSMKGKNDKECDIIGLTVENNLWFDLENILKYMVIFYDINEIDVQGKLQVCIKLDEMELTNRKKLERVSLVLVNYALCPDYVSKGHQHIRESSTFSVQSEEHTWWLGMFQVHKENYDVLKWVFDQTEIPRLIGLYEVGQMLQVEGHGKFQVVFHLASDLKTEKAMHNISSTAAQTSNNCLYCMHVMKEKRGKRSHSELSCKQDLPPDRHEKDPHFDAILPIPLERVHVCTLHALVRIVEKMIHHSCCFVWNIKDEKQRAAGIKRVEKVLSEAGLHGGNVKLEKDLKASTKSSRPAKVSLGGDKARHFLRNSDPKRKGTFDIGKQLVLAERDRTLLIGATKDKLDAWNALSDFNFLLQKHVYVQEDVLNFKSIANRFTEAYIKAWGESEVTHYIHILHAHGPWFAKTYGSLAIWNAQGMEKSHKQAKHAFHRATQRGGCSVISKPLYQMSTWFYRRLIAKHEKNMKEKDACANGGVELEESRLKRRAAWMNSAAHEACLKWRSKRRRVHSKYVPLEVQKFLKATIVDTYDT